MMTNELRCRNYVYYLGEINSWDAPDKPKPEPIVVEIQPPQIVECKTFPERYRGIPLTEYWFAKNCFEYKAGDKFKMYMVNINGEKFTVTIEDKKEFPFLRRFETKLYYVHEVQNMFFAEKRFELPIITLNTK